MFNTGIHVPSQSVYVTKTDTFDYLGSHVRKFVVSMSQRERKRGGGIECSTLYFSHAYKTSYGVTVLFLLLGLTEILLLGQTKQIHTVEKMCCNEQIGLHE